MLGWAAAGKLARGLRGRGARAEATLAAGSNQVRARGAGPRPSPCLRTAPPWSRRRPPPPPLAGSLQAARRLPVCSASSPWGGHRGG